jgi:hypothetical protein
MTKIYNDPADFSGEALSGFVGACPTYVQQVGGPPDTLPSLTLNLVGVAGLTVDVARAGLAALPRSTIAVATDTAVEIKLAALPPGVTVRLDDNPTDSTVPVPPGRHRITLAAEGEQPRWFM